MRAKSLPVVKKQRKTHRRAKSLSVRKTASNRANTPFKQYNPDIPHYAHADKMFGDSQILLNDCQTIINNEKSDTEKLEQLRDLLCDYTPTRLFNDNTR